MSDQISNFLTIIRNASSAKKETCTARFSKLNLGIGQILVNEGYLEKIEESTDGQGHPSLTIRLKYVNDVPAINGIERKSKPGRRLYFGSDEIPRVLNGMGMAILTTSKGVLKDRDCRRDNIGGELLCSVW